MTVVASRLLRGFAGRTGVSPSASYILALVLSVACAVTQAEDWPTYQHDNARSGVSGETLALPLQHQWVHTPVAPPSPGWGDPHSVPIEGVLEMPRVKFDDAFYVAAVGEAVYLASSADNCISSLDAATGTVRWKFFTGGPIRLAPTVHEGRVYAGSDDGHVYCLNAADGKVIWKLRAAPTDQQVLGHGKMISMWPLRTGVLVDDGVAYFTAGIFPGERIYVCAVSAEDGSRVWTNDTISDGSASRDGFSPQGYLLASDTALFVPSGRCLPAAFDRKTGRFMYQRGGSWRAYGVLGGTYALLDGEHLYSGTERQVVTLNQDSGNMGFAWFPGRRLVVTKDTSYMLSDAGITALDRIAYPALSRKHKALGGKRQGLLGLRPKPEDLQDRLKAVDEELKEVEDAIAACTRWRLEREDLYCMIVAGDIAFIGGEKQLAALDKTTGEELWTEEIEGTAKGLAVADGRLLASTDKGAIYCFGTGAPAALPLVVEAVADPYAPDTLTGLYRRAGKTIVEQTGVTRGYCLVLGCGTGRLAYELAKRTDLMIYGVEPDAHKVRAARAALDKAGFYGTRVSVEQSDGKALPYSDYFAHLIVSEGALVGRRPSVPAAEALRLLKPCGGVLCIGQPEGAPKRLSANALKAWLMPEFEDAQVQTQNGAWATYVRGPLPGAGKWTHQHGDPGNTASSEDTFVKCPLEVLWYGKPGPSKVPSRHARNAAPLTINGRVYLQGINRIMCFDAYNGFLYWEREIKGAYRVYVSHRAGNLACTENSLFVGVGPECLRLDAETGETIATYEVPPDEDGTKRNWAYVAVADGLLFGSTAIRAGASDRIFATDIESGQRRWVHEGKNIADTTIAISDGGVFFADSRATPEQREQALTERPADLREAAEAAAAEAKSPSDKTADSKPLYAAPKISPTLDGDLSDWAKTTPVTLPLSGKAPERYANWQGKKDLSAQFYLGWDERNLYFAAAVTDDVFHQPFAGENIWEGDCIQVAMDLLRTSSYDKEYGFALVSGKPFTWCWQGPQTDAGRIRLETKKRTDGVNYEAAIPWQILKPFSPAAAKAVGFTVAIMDSDGREWEGPLEWTPGIVNGKKPSAYGTVLLVSTQKEDEVRAAREKLTPATTAQNDLAKADVRIAVGLNAATGNTLWEKPVDLTDCSGIGPGGGTLIAMCNEGALVFCGAHGDGHYWAQFLGDEFKRRRATALSTKDGARLWSEAVGCRIRPLIVGDTFYAEPWAFDLHTGEQKMRPHPLTGLPSPWQLERPGHHCGCISGCPNALFFRSYSFAYYDLLAEQGTQHFSGQRPGCWINMIPANGLVVVPEASSGCICLFSMHCTTVFKPRKTNKTWGIFSAPGPTMPVKHMRLNMGAPGDRADADGKLWLSYPRPYSRMQVKINLATTILPGCGFFSTPGEYAQIEGADDPWLYASGCTGLTKCSVPLVGEADGPAIYTVRLACADRDNTKPGERVFDIKLQDKVVERDFDIIGAAGGPNKAVVREFKGIEVDGALKIELVPRLAKPEKNQAPLVQAIEIIRERVLHVGMATPSFVISDLDTDKSGEVKLANYTDKEFVGTLRIAAPEMFGVKPAETEVKLAPGEKMTVPITLTIEQKGDKGDFHLDCKLVWNDGKLEAQREAGIEYLGPRGRVAFIASEDTYVNHGASTTNYGRNATMAVDGGGQEFGDSSHNIAYLKFPVDVPGKPVSVTFRIYVPTGGHTQSGDSGRIKLVEGDWDEYKITYANRPEPGKEIGSLGRVNQDEWVERKLDVDLTGMKQLCIALDPTGNDGATYVSREGQQKPEIVIEYEAAQ